MAGIRIPFIAEVTDFLRGKRSVTEGLEDVVDSLDDVTDAGKDTERHTTAALDDTGDAADKLERKFRDVFDTVSKESKKAGDSLGDSMHDGTRKAGEGVDEFRDEANSTAKEAAASFDGSADSVAGAFQEVAANAFAGFGPAGAVAGLAAAAGIGFAIQALQKAADDANALKQRVLDLAGELSEVGGNLDQVDFTAKMRDWGLEVKDVKSAWEFWQKDSASNFELMETKADQFDLTLSDLFRGMSGSDSAAAVRAMGELNGKIEDQEDVVRRLPQAMGGYNTAQGRANAAELDRLTSLKGLRSELEKNAHVTSDAVDLQQRMDAALQSSAEATAHAAEVQQGYAGALEDMADPVGSYEEILSRKEQAERTTAEKTAAATKDSSDSWEDYAKDVNVTIDDLIDDLDAQIKAAQDFETNLGKIAAAGGQAVADELRKKGPAVAGATAKLIAEAGPAKQKEYLAKYPVATGMATAGGIAAGITAGAPKVAAAVTHLSDHAGSVTIPVSLDTRGMNDDLEAWRKAWIRAHGGLSIPTKIPQPV